MSWNSTATVSNPDVQRSYLVRESKVYPITLTQLRVWDAMQTVLPGSAATDDCALITGTPGTDAPTIQAGDIGGQTISRKFAFEFGLPPEYDAGQTAKIRVKAGMVTTVADTSATIDFSAYEIDRSGAVGSDLVQTAAQDMNSITYADFDFTLDATNLNPGEKIVIVGTIAAQDSGDAGEMIPEVSALEMVLSVKG